ncbi:MAG: hypothetical protein HY282_00430 [Nitrospirae bacterium]|nr:hypothetical protein [Candidatus Manganitrophaceae bacterium]
MRFSVFLIAGVVLLQGCGYSLRMVDVADERREVRSKQEKEEHVVRLDAQMKEMQEQFSRLQADLKLAKEENRKGLADLQKRRADVDIRFDEGDIQLRIIQGKIEKEERRSGDLSHQVENLAFRLNEQEKKSEALQKALQAQIEEVKRISAGLQKGSEEQDRRLKEVAGHLTQLSKEIQPALSAQAAQLDEMGKQLRQIGGTDVEQLSKSLVDLSKALDLLGEKITAKVDEQEKLLSKTTKRVQVLESKVAPKGKQSSLQEEGSGEPSNPAAPGGM